MLSDKFKDVLQFNIVESGAKQLKYKPVKFKAYGQRHRVFSKLQKKSGLDIEVESNYKIKAFSKCRCGLMGLGSDGSTAVVYEAVKKADKQGAEGEQKVAIKKVQNVFESTDRALSLLREIKILNSLGEQNNVSISRKNDCVL